jgi:DNA-binding HxlR family transcriptional regulator
MATDTPASTRPDEVHCSIERSLKVLGERWTLLVLREAFAGRTRFSDFQAALGVAPDVLTQRLGTLMAAGILEKRPYREATSRARFAYHLTTAGEEVKIVLGALQQWGDSHCPHPDGPLARRVSSASGRPLRVAFVDDRGEESSLADADIGAPLESRD